MKKELGSIKDTLKYYGLDRVTCLEHPVAVVLESYMKHFGSYFYMITKIAQSYSFSDEKNGKDLVVSFWNRYLGIDVESFPLSREILVDVKKYVDKGLPVLLFGNLIELFYSKNYKEKNWEHLFLFTGYDDEKKLLIIQDDIHLKGTPKYEQFWLPESIVENMLLKDRFFGDNSKGFTLIKNNKFNTHSDKDILLYIIKLLIKGISEGKYAEKEIIEKLYKVLLDENLDFAHKEFYIETLSLRFLNVIKYKEVFIEELVSHLERFCYPKEGIEDLRIIRNELHYVWEKYTQKELVKCMRRKEELCVIIPEEIIVNEAKLSKHLSKCIEYLESCKEVDEVRENKNIIYLTENNESNIIAMEKDNIVFLFDDKKIYNSWTEDECPKVFLDKIIDANRKKWFITSHISIDESFMESKFEAGLFIKTDNNIYFGGIDVDNKLVLDIIGRNNLDVNYSFITDITIFMEYKDDNIYFGIINGTEKIVKLRRAFSAGEEITFGLACKTWGNGEKLKVTFRDYRVEVGA